MNKFKIIEELKRDISNFLENYPKGIIMLWWPTASWKTSISLEIAKFLGNVQIVSADSRQVYKYMDIWTDKVDISIREKIPHHQIDLVEPDKIYTAWEWKNSTKPIIQNIQKKWDIPFLVGGTWLYIDTIYKNFSMPQVWPDMELRRCYEQKERKNPGILHQNLKDIDPESASQIHPNSTRYIIRALEIYEKTWKTKSQLAKPQPVDRPIFMWGLIPWKNVSNDMINNRVLEMLEKWLVKEVEKLIDMWYDKTLPSMQGIWYKEVLDYIDWKYDFESMVETLKKNTQKFAKRQRTWFRRYLNDKKYSPKSNVVYKIFSG